MVNDPKTNDLIVWSEAGDSFFGAQRLIARGNAFRAYVRVASTRS